MDYITKTCNLRCNMCNKELDEKDVRILFVTKDNISFTSKTTNIRESEINMTSVSLYPRYYCPECYVVANRKIILEEFKSEE